MSSSFQKPQAQQSCTYEESVSLAWRELVVKISCELSLIPTTQQVYCWRYMQSLEKAAKQERVLHKVPWALKKRSFSMLTIPSVKLSVLWWLYFEAGQPSESAFWPEILHGSLKSITQKKKKQEGKVSFSHCTKPIYLGSRFIYYCMESTFYWT